MKEIELTQDKVVLVDDEDFEWLNQYKWCAHKGHTTWYSLLKSDGKHILMHRLIMNPDSNIHVDHKDHNGLNNQRSNLRNCTRAQNQWNSRPNYGRQYKGVTWREGTLKFQVYISLGNKSICLGSYDNEVEAALAYNVGAITLFGEFAYLNEVDGINTVDFCKHINGLNESGNSKLYSS